jgi:hypothetical protein
MVILLTLSCPVFLKAAETDDLALTITPLSHSKIKVGLANPGETPLRIWREDNTWGVDCFRLLITRGNDFYSFYQRNTVAYTQDNPHFDEIRPHHSIDRIVDLRSDLWQGQHLDKILLVKGDRITVIYDVPSTKESEQYHVWHGFASVQITIPR